MDAGDKLFPDTAVDRYVSSGLRRIDGWLCQLDARLIRAIGSCQDELHVNGALGEIGVHHGKLFILLYLMLSRGEKSFAVDLFDQQALNVDGSGRGDLAIFLGNLRAVAGNTDLVEVVQSNSTDLAGTDLDARISQRVRLFSIDGGHTAQVTYHDMELADDVLADEGVIILDDYFNAEWPGVSEGALRFFTGHAHALVPFAIGQNKVFASRPAFSSRYGEYLVANTKKGCFCKYAEFLGRDVPVFKDPRRLYDRIKQSEFARTHRNHPLANRVKPVLRRLLGG